jgi:PAS domain S-box-containing protein
MVLEPRVARRIAFAIGLAILTLAGLEATGLAPAACLDNGSGRCVSADALHTTATGAGIAILTFGCALFVTALVQVLSRERDRLAGTEKALLEEQDKLQSIIDCMADGVIFADANGKIHLRNRASDALWGGHPPPREDLHVCHSKETWERLKEKLENAGPNEMHPVLQVGPRSFEANFAQVRTGQHELRGVVMVARDVTERLQAQKWRMNKERMAVVGKLAASLAHELNNPLGSIALFTRHALKRVPEGNPMADYLGTVQTNAQQCKKIVKDLLTYARQRPPEQRLSSLHALIGDVTRTLEHEAERAGVDVHGEVVPEEESAEVYGDPDQLRQVLVNLGLNAIEAMNPAGGGTLRIGAQVCPDGAARFEVCDTGPGISDEQRENIFQAFYTTKAEGTGLGLAVAQDVIAAHGGELELESEPGSGCAFRFRLPGAIQSAPDTVQVMESSP